MVFSIFLFSLKVKIGITEIRLISSPIQTPKIELEDKEIKILMVKRQKNIVFCPRKTFFIS